jgi:hypothetical protein
VEVIHGKNDGWWCMTEVEIIKWLLDGDPAIRWQAMRDLLGSFWALIPSIGSAAMYIVRTSLEDKTLIEELPGYSDYTQQTHFRLLPGVW